MNTIVYLIRHANKELMWNGQDVLRPLTNKGEEQAERLANQPELQNVDIIYASPYVRTINTIKPLSNKLGLEIENVDAFRERGIVDEEDRTPVYIREQWRNFALKRSGGESLYEVQQRSVGMLKKIIVEHKGKSIIVVTHMAAIGAILKYYDSSFDHGQYRLITSPDIWKLEFQDEKLVRMSHISLI